MSEDILPGLRLPLIQWFALAEGQIPEAVEARVLDHLERDVKVTQQEFTDIVALHLRAADVPGLRVRGTLPEQPDGEH